MANSIHYLILASFIKSYIIIGVFLERHLNSL